MDLEYYYIFIYMFIAHVHVDGIEGANQTVIPIVFEWPLQMFSQFTQALVALINFRNLKSVQCSQWWPQKQQQQKTTQLL